MKIDLNEIWHTKIAMASADMANNIEMFDKMGIDISIPDEDVQYVDYWVPFRWIKSVESTGHGDFNILLRDGDIINSKENPFKEKE